ncbi:MAG: HlyD family efflux transporter periplasmic adaptor subunit [Chlamydiae bacterium]|nr:HlyD family efflux transporter periplasmic adaptor subunit [Chlamydiota bacterium]
MWWILPIGVLGISGFWISQSFHEPVSDLIKGQVIYGDIRQVVRGVGILDAKDVISLKASFPGILEKVYCEKGQTLHKDVLLFKIKNEGFSQDMRLLKAKIEQAKAELKRVQSPSENTSLFEAKEALEKAERSSEETKKEFHDEKELYEKGFISKKSLDEFENKFETAEREATLAVKRYETFSKGPSPQEIALKKAELYKMRSEWKHLKEQWKGHEVKASFDAWVVDILKKEGDTLSLGDGIVNLVNTEDPWVVQSEVYEGDVHKIKKGDTAWVKLLGESERREAKVTEVSLVAKSFANTRKFSVQLSLEKQIEGPVRLGVGADYEILRDERIHVLTLPIQFVVRKAEETGVWTLKNSKKEFRPIKTGMSDDVQIEIVEGLKEGEEVVLPSEENQISKVKNQN